MNIDKHLPSKDLKKYKKLVKQLEIISDKIREYELEAEYNGMKDIYFDNQ